MQPDREGGEHVIPEHLWDEVKRILQQNNRLADPGTPPDEVKSFALWFAEAAATFYVEVHARGVPENLAAMLTSLFLGKLLDICGGIVQRKGK